MFSRTNPSPPSGPSAHRAYVVGDVHGRLDLLETLLDKVHADLEQRDALDTLLVFVGDLIDRGPHSAEVVERLRTYEHPRLRPVFLLGNHEEVVLRIIAGDGALVRSWLKFGGAECFQSYGGDPQLLASMPGDAAVEAVRAAIPDEHVAFFNSFADTLRFGDYLIVHAGIRPGVALDEQQQSDLRWIRDPFLDDDTNHGFVVIHGHTIAQEVEEKPNRIAIDTGAFATGVLTALGIEGTERWVLDTRVPAEGDISPAH